MGIIFCLFYYEHAGCETIELIQIFGLVGLLHKLKQTQLLFSFRLLDSISKMNAVTFFSWQHMEPFKLQCPAT